MTTLREMPPAGLMRRLAAMCYDWLLLAAVLFITTLCLLVIRGGVAVEPGTWWYSLSMVLIGFGFFAWFWTHGGQTLGMRAWNIRVERDDGRPLSWRDAGSRFAAAGLLFLPPGLGLLWIVIDPHKAGWHDRLSGTRIVHLVPTRDARVTTSRTPNDGR